MCKIRMNGFTLVFILQKEAPKRKLVKKRERDNYKEVLLIKKRLKLCAHKTSNDLPGMVNWSMPSITEYKS